MTGILPDQRQPSKREKAVVINWDKVNLIEHLQKEFNFEKNPIFLTESQIIYCINLLRYSPDHFKPVEKLQEMFNLVIATTQGLYNELGLLHRFDAAVSDKLSNKQINIKICI